MSRCFPFPPPGYEAKLRSEHKDLLKKHKEEKQKKERKERGRRKRKEKHSNHRKDKHNRKHKREKYKDKRKNKDGNRNKSETLEKESRKNEDPGNGRPKEKVQNEDVKDIKPVNESVTEILGQEGDANNTSGSTSKLLPRSTKSFGSAGSKEKKKSCSSVVEKYRRDDIAYDNVKGKNTGLWSKTQVQNGKSLQVGSVEKHSTRRHSHNRTGLPQRGAECTSMMTTVVSDAGSPDSLVRTEQVDQEPADFSHSPYGQKMGIKSGSDKNFHIKMNQQCKDITVEAKARTKELKTNDHKCVKDKDRDQIVEKRNAKYKNKEKEKVGKVVVNKQEHKVHSLEPNKNKVDGLMQLGRVNAKFTSDDVKKRKDVEANSSLLEHSRRMNKLPRISPCNPPRANNEILEHYQGNGPSSSTVPVGKITYEADRFQDRKECYNNGVTGAHNLEQLKTSVSSSNYGSNQVFMKPPHPDVKYLTQVYSIPAMDDCSGCIDQGWLLSRDCVDRKTEILEPAQSPQVWAEAQLFDSADVVALPYVVPL